MTEQKSLLTLLEPGHTALVVVDIQNDFCDAERYPAAAAMLPKLQSLIGGARDAGVRVIWTQAVHDESNDSEVWRTRLDMRPNRRDTCRTGSPGAQFYSDFHPASGELVIVKHRYSAFIGTALEMNLRALQVNTLALTGIATNVCVESTARDAFQRDFHVVLVADCTATTSDLLQHATEENIGTNFGRVASSAEMLHAWQAVRALTRS